MTTIIILKRKKTQFFEKFQNLFNFLKQESIFITLFFHKDYFFNYPIGCLGKKKDRVVWDIDSKTKAFLFLLNFYNSNLLLVLISDGPFFSLSLFGFPSTNFELFETKNEFECTENGIFWINFSINYELKWLFGNLEA